jgi:O-Antigen ligase
MAGVRRPAPFVFLATAIGFILAVPLLVYFVGRFGLLAPVAIVLLITGIVLIDKPKVLLAGFVALCILAQYRSKGLVGHTGLFYERKGPITPQEAYFGLVVASVALQCWRRRLFRMPDPYTGGLLLLVAAIAAGVIVGHENGVGFKTVFEVVRLLMYIVVTPFLVVNVIDSERDLRRALGFGAALVLVLAVFGLLGVASGQGANQVDGAQATFYVAAPVWLMMLFVLGRLAAALMRVKLPRWVAWGWPLPFLALALSFERGFWLGAVAGLAVVVATATGTVGRRLIVPTVVLVGVIVWVLVTAGVGAGLHGPVVDRAQSLHPEKVLSSDQDRYRLGERANVLANLREHPVDGIGIGVPWTARHGLTLDEPGARTYVHTAFLWWWLKMGLLGALAYVILTATTLVASFRLRKTARDPYMRALSAGLVGATIGIAVTELTATHLGSDPAFAVVLPAVWGLVAVARRQVAEAPVAQRAARPAVSPRAPLPA